MRVLVLDGNPDADDKSYGAILSTFVQKLIFEGKPVEVVTLHQKNIKQCVGCWTCWVNMPGKCMLKDDVEGILMKIVESDLVIFASPIILGFMSSLLKRFTDRMIPLVLPYFQVLEGEIHHVPRYENRPLLAAVVVAEEETDREDHEIIFDIYTRNALNLSTKLSMYKVFDRNGEELASR